jgi:hypothetical protein
MEIPKEAIAELKQFHFQVTGEMLSDGEASEIGQELFRLFLAVYEPIPRNWLEELSG